MGNINLSFDNILTQDRSKLRFGFWKLGIYEIGEEQSIGTQINPCSLSKYTRRDLKINFEIYLCESTPTSNESTKKDFNTRFSRKKFSLILQFRQNTRHIHRKILTIIRLKFYLKSKSKSLTINSRQNSIKTQTLSKTLYKENSI